MGKRITSVSTYPKFCVHGHCQRILKHIHLLYVNSKEASVRRVRRWAFSLQEVLADPLGRQHFMRFLEKEFSSENLKYVLRTC